MTSRALDTLTSEPQSYGGGERRRQTVIAAGALALVAGAALVGASLGVFDSLGPAHQRIPLSTTERTTMSRQDLYLTAVEDGYRRLAARSVERARYNMARDFEYDADTVRQRGAALLRGAGDMVDRAEAEEAEVWRRRIEAAFIGGLPERAPVAAAEMVVAYDCVVRASQNDGSRDIRAICRAELETALRLAPALAETEVETASTGLAADSFVIPGSAAPTGAPTVAIAAGAPSTQITEVGYDPLAPARPRRAIDDIETGAVTPMAVSAPPAPTTASSPEPAAAVAPVQSAPRAEAEAPARRGSANEREIAVDPILFNEGSDHIGLDERLRLLEFGAVAAREANAGRRVTLIVSGHADSTGRSDANAVLADRRAQAVAQVLVDRRDELLDDLAARGRIEVRVLSFGDRRPARINRNRDGSLRNQRRVEVTMRVQ